MSAEKDPESQVRSEGPRKVEVHRVVLGPESGPWVLVLHGITESRRYWLPRIRPLAERRRLVIPDLPGFGLSPKPYADYTPRFFVESLRSLVAREIPDGAPYSIVGHSLGALLGMELAAVDPGRVDRLALLNLPRFNDPDEAHHVWFAGSFSYRNLLAANSVGANLAQVRRTGVRLTARYVRRLPWSVVSDARRFTFRSLTSTLEHCLLHYALDDILDAVPRIPVLVIQGDADQVAPLDRILDLPHRYPHPELFVIRGAGHHPFHTHSQLCLPALDAFLAGRPVGPLADGKLAFAVPAAPAGSERGPRAAPVVDR